jgi:hypothetical protein
MSLSLQLIVVAENQVVKRSKIGDFCSSNASLSTSFDPYPMYMLMITVEKANVKLKSGFLNYGLRVRSVSQPRFSQPRFGALMLSTIGVIEMRVDQRPSCSH